LFRTLIPIPTPSSGVDRVPADDVRRGRQTLQLADGARHTHEVQLDSIAVLHRMTASTDYITYNARSVAHNIALFTLMDPDSRVEQLNA